MKFNLQNIGGKLTKLLFAIHVKTEKFEMFDFHGVSKARPFINTVWIFKHYNMFLYYMNLTSSNGLT